MGDKCPPLRLPIHIETSCATKNSCQCDSDVVSNKCDTLCETNSSINFQGTFQNNCCKEIEQIPSIVIAYLSNVRNNNCQPYHSINLNPISLNWCDFLFLFYHTNSTFNIFPTSRTSCAINFSGQTYENTRSQTLRLNLAQQIKNAWAHKCETTVDKLPAKTSIFLDKEVCYTRSLLSSNSAIALSLDQAIYTLLNNGEIAPADSTSSANVQFVVQYNYTFAPLNITIQINFAYNTKIPCYKNLNKCDNWCPPYSKEYNCRSCGDLPTNTTSSIDEFSAMKHAFENESACDDVSHSEFDSIHESINGSINEINKVINKPPSHRDYDTKTIDDKSFVSLDSSKW
jgi:hypothetical protein